MATRKASTKQPTSTAKTTVTIRALVRVAEDGGFDIIGFGDRKGPADINELKDVSDSTLCLDGQYEEYLIEIEVPAYSNFVPDVRFKMKVSAE